MRDREAFDNRYREIVLGNGFYKPVGQNADPLTSIHMKLNRAAAVYRYCLRRHQFYLQLCAEKGIEPKGFWSKWNAMAIIPSLLGRDGSPTTKGNRRGQTRTDL